MPVSIIKKTTISLMLGACFMSANAFADTQLLRQPSVSRDHLAFVYGGDIWLADRDGKNPTRCVGWGDAGIAAAEVVDLIFGMVAADRKAAGVHVVI